MARYRENALYIINHIISLVEYLQSSEAKTFITEALGVQFGFKKLFIGLTDVGKIVSFSSIDGKVMWSNYFGEQSKPQKILIRNMMEREIEEFTKHGGQVFTQ